MAKSNSWPWKAYLPFRLVWQLYYLSALLARLPLWIFKFALFRSLRPHPEWTFEQSLKARLIRTVVDAQSKIGISDPLSLRPGAEKERFKTITPFPKNLYKGPLESHVTPTTIGGTWYPSLKTARDIGPQGTVILHIHGGAFVTGDGRTAGLGFLSNTLVKYARVDAVFAPQYRLSGYGDTNPFPAGLQDVLTSYLYLVRTLEIQPRNIVVSGDSAGGNLAIAFLRYLAEYGNDLGIPNPQSAVLISPWTSPQNSLGSDITYMTNPNYETDILPPEFTRWGAATYAAKTPVTDPYITPLGNPFATRVPMFVTQGAVEILEIDGTQWAKEMARVEGNNIESVYEPLAIHDTLLIGDRSGWVESARTVAGRIGDFIETAGRPEDTSRSDIPLKL